MGYYFASAYTGSMRDTRDTELLFFPVSAEVTVFSHTFFFFRFDFYGRALLWGPPRRGEEEFIVGLTDAIWRSPATNSNLDKSAEAPPEVALRFFLTRPPGAREWC